MTTYNVLIMGASYGSLLATKLLFGGHKITMVCLPAEVEAFNRDGARVRLPIKGRKDPIELDSRELPGSLKINVLQVTLPTNFKVARFDSGAYTAILRQMQADIEAARYDPGDGAIELPVKLKVHDSIFVPLAKWAMLLTGNYRCVTPDRAIDIKDAVHTDIETSRSVYNWVCGVSERMGASPNDLVPFEKYAAAARDLVRPSSAARALFNGAPNIERTDRLVQAVAAQYGMRNAVVDQTVALVDARLAANRKAAA